MTCELKQFSFTDLIDLIRTILKTKKCSNEDILRGGCGLLTVENLEKHVHEALDELINRIQEQWTINRIKKFLKGGNNLPDFISNAFCMNVAQVGALLYKDPPAIGAEIVDGIDYIYFIFNGMKYHIDDEDDSIKISKINVVIN